ncbi:DUF2306 domain-containing protein [Roseivirga sp.]|uniref:DUF2306 domain-containing protein n=1 Tax=Roseivirga sp. TaxID=1964215 RepID=UPI003B52DBEA
MNSKIFLNRSVEAWFVIATIGIWIFAYYVIAFYVGSGMQGNWEQWNDVLPHGYIKGDGLNNVSMAIHIFLAAVVLVGGPLQFIDTVRRRAPRFHRYNGRLYVVMAFLISLGGLFIIFYKGSVGGTIGNISMSINTFLILLAAFYTLRFALQDKFRQHRQWAIRLFLFMGGVWFFRIGLMFWLFIFGGKPVGFDMETFRGPFLTVLGFSQYLIPLVVAELYFYAETKGSTKSKNAFAILMIILSLITAIGVFAATTGLWLPRIK